MKKFVIISYIILISFCTYTFMSPQKVKISAHSLTDEEIIEYINTLREEGIDEEEIDEKVNNYIEENTREESEKIVYKMSFWEALRMSFIIISIVIGGIILIFSFSSFHYRELYGVGFFEGIRISNFISRFFRK